MPELNEILEERGKRYGSFAGHAEIVQSMKTYLLPRLRERFSELPLTKANAIKQDVVLEAAEMILHKLGRIANGDPLYADSWDDIAGYATLVANHIKEQSS